MNSHRRDKHYIELAVGQTFKPSAYASVFPRVVSIIPILKMCKLRPISIK